MLPVLLLHLGVVVFVVLAQETSYPFAEADWYVRVIGIIIMNIMSLLLLSLSLPCVDIPRSQVGPSLSCSVVLGWWSVWRGSRFGAVPVAFRGVDDFSSKLALTRRQRCRAPYNSGTEMEK